MAPGSMEPAIGPPKAADDDSAASLARQTALTDLARTALLGAQQRALLERAAQLVLDAPDAETCGIYEYLPAVDITSSSGPRPSPPGGVAG